MPDEHWFWANFGVCGVLAFGFLYAIKHVFTTTVPAITTTIVAMFASEREARLRMHNESRADRKEMKDDLVKRLDSLHEDVCAITECLPKKWRSGPSPETKPPP